MRLLRLTGQVPFMGWLGHSYLALGLCPALLKVATIVGVYAQTEPPADALKYCVSAVCHTCPFQLATMPWDSE